MSIIKFSTKLRVIFYSKMFLKRLILGNKVIVSYSWPDVYNSEHFWVEDDPQLCREFYYAHFDTKTISFG
jgi:hypothetical protein